MSDPYATWRPEMATDEPDGLPDRKIVPLIEHLRDCGVVTLQSCYGHYTDEGGYYSGSDGHLWVQADSVTEKSVRGLAHAPFDEVRRVIWPEQRWEFFWRPSVSAEAVEWLYRLQWSGVVR